MKKVYNYIVQNEASTKIMNMFASMSKCLGVQVDNNIVITNNCTCSQHVNHPEDLCGYCKVGFELWLDDGEVEETKHKRFEVLLKNMMDKIKNR